MPDDVDAADPDDVLTPDAIANHSFHTAFRGFDPVEVRAFLARVADLLRAAEDAAESAAQAAATSERDDQPAAEDASAVDELAGADPHAIVAAAVAEAEEILRDARERAKRMEDEAVAEGRRIVDVARAEADALLDRARGEAETELRSAKSKARAEVGREATRLRAEAEQAAAEARVDAERHAARVKQEAEKEAAAIVEAARERGREMVVEAQAARERMLTDLARRKRAAQAQIEQLRAGRDRLLETLKTARRTVDEITFRFDATGEPVRRERGDERNSERGGERAADGAGGDAPIAEADERQTAGGAGQEGEAEAGREQPAPGLPSLPEPAGPTSEGVRIIGTRANIDAPRASQAATAPTSSPEHATASPPTVGQEPAGRVTEGRRPERKSSALRILRRARGADRDDGGEPSVTGPASDQRPEPAHRPAAPAEAGEGVRILASPAVPEEEGARTTGGPGAPEPEAERQPVEAAESEADAPAEPAAEPEAEPEAEGETAGEPHESDVPAATGEQAADGTDDGHEEEASAAGDVDDIFARIRAEREAATAAAREVLAAEPSPTGSETAGARGDADAPTDGRPTADAPQPAGDTAPDGGAVTGGQPPASPDGEAAVSNADEALLQERDRAIADLEESLTRRLKRALQDEQNAALDRLRTHRGGLVGDVLVGAPDEQSGPYREVARVHLEPAARAGAASSPMGTAAVSVDDLASQLATDIATSLRQRLDRALEQANRDELELAAVAERVNATYREWKTQRIQRLTIHYVNAAYNRGIFLATPEGTPLRWLVDDEDPCPDCDDNALSGATPRGIAYPTGQMLPPAHAGCRCLLVRVTA